MGAKGKIRGRPGRKYLPTQEGESNLEFSSSIGNSCLEVKFEIDKILLTKDLYREKTGLYRAIDTL